jgi:nucleotide-binding universal stress UspA family protein
MFKNILCPVDFSEHSRQALRFAALLSRRARAQLIVMFVEDPLLVAAAAVEYDAKAIIEQGRVALRQFVKRTVAPYGIALDSVTLDVAVGKAHEEIAWTADRLLCDLIVMGTHGLGGASRMMIGSTTHRLLRRSALPILAIPPVKGRADAPSRRWPGEWAVVPVALGQRERGDVLSAAAVAAELKTKVLLVHVVEPLTSLPWLDIDVARRNRQRVRQALAKLERLKTESLSRSECRVLTGKPANQIAALAAERDVGLVIMTRRRGEGLFGPRQGSISYQVLQLAKTPVLALPADRKWLRRAQKRGKP